MAEKLTKRQLKQDQFLQHVYVALAWMRENPLASVGAVIALVAVVSLAVRIGGSAAGPSEGNREAEEALIAARNEFAQGRLESGAEALREVKQRYRSDRAGREAAYLLGNSLFELGDYAAAQTAFEDFMREPLYEDLLLDGARLAIAACKEESNDLSGAVGDYRQLWTSGNSPGTRVQAALAAARVARAQGQDGQAREFYQGIVDQYPKSPEAEDARFKLLELPGS
jgi:tetratricopeptide (TPR) repeat protein